MKKLFLLFAFFSVLIFGSCTHTIVSEMIQHDDEPTGTIETSVDDFTGKSLFTAMSMIDAKRHSRGVYTKKADVLQTDTDQYLVHQVKEELVSGLGIMMSEGKDCELLFIKELWMERDRLGEFEDKYDVVVVMGDEAIDGVLYTNQDMEQGINQYEFVSDDKAYFIRANGHFSNGFSIGETKFNWWYDITIGEAKLVSIKEETYQVAAEIDEYNKLNSVVINYIDPETITGDTIPVRQRIFSKFNAGYPSYFMATDVMGDYWYKLENLIYDDKKSGLIRLVEMENGRTVEQEGDRFSEIHPLQDTDARKSAMMGFKIIDSENEEVLIMDEKSVDASSESLIYDVLKALE